MIREELSRLFTREERHRRLFARLLLAFGLSVVVFAVGTVLIWASESGQKGGNIHGFGDAAYFCAVQLLTVSSSMTNPLTPAGKIVDVGLEAWGHLRRHRSRGQLRHVLQFRRHELVDDRHPQQFGDRRSQDGHTRAWLRDHRTSGWRPVPNPCRTQPTGAIDGDSRERRRLTELNLTGR